MRHDVPVPDADGGVRENLGVAYVVRVIVPHSRSCALIAVQSKKIMGSTAIRGSVRKSAGIFIVYLPLIARMLPTRDADSSAKYGVNQFGRWQQEYRAWNFRMFAIYASIP
jgi:hypothetical protein